jgi:hypothetical protein
VFVSESVVRRKRDAENCAMRQKRAYFWAIFACTLDPQPNQAYAQVNSKRFEDAKQEQENCRHHHELGIEKREIAT